ncbi:hypothetical protein DFJ58DRAFT_845764 [Suillus subalutaceus]|uniref:uncharacterized protein n=1 Tax=Suillus subalutaceus TaxID=48586 RepID=UPI001B8601C0|nr:uncharacterized protein DFJ58DRAFT_845764 [Suillus subalutaceus]KAG1839203.1 hypothetical protein DFJ58DRAFT_845764 [Suillus subalutaceus]
MSFLAASGDTMVFELWPSPMRKEIQRLQGDHDFASWELFPPSLQDMADWADVYQDHEKQDSSRNCLLIYMNMQDAKPGVIQELVWVGNATHFEDETEVTRAVQHINLSSGGHEKPLIAHAHARDVFQGRHISTEMSIQQEAGKILAMDSVLLTEGDFVDVGAKLDFIIRRDRQRGMTLRCFLTCTHIVRMIPANYVKHMKLDKKTLDRKHAMTPPAEERAPKKTHITLALDTE